LLLLVVAYTALPNGSVALEQFQPDLL